KETLGDSADVRQLDQLGVAGVSELLGPPAGQRRRQDQVVVLALPPGLEDSVGRNRHLDAEILKLLDQQVGLGKRPRNLKTARLKQDLQTAHQFLFGDVPTAVVAGRDRVPGRNQRRTQERSQLRARAGKVGNQSARKRRDSSPWWSGLRSAARPG